MCEVLAVQVTEFNSIGSDTPIPRRDDGVPYSQELEACISALDQIPVEISWLPMAMSAEVIAIDRFIAKTRSGMVFGEPWLQVMEQTNGNVETTNIDDKAFTNMTKEERIDIHNIIGSELCVSSHCGQKVFNKLKSEISQGNRVCLSFENIEALSTAFLRSAIGQLYSGEIKRNIDEMISFANLSPGRELIVAEVIRTSKEYYSDPNGYVAKLKELFADD